jgi:RHS repeat-associated protein
LQEKLAAGAGLITRHYDLLARPLSLLSQNYQEQNACYDSVGNLVSIQKQNDTLYYAYDELYHLIKEPHHTYTFDGLANKTSQDGRVFPINALNQTQELDYDKRGNPRSFEGKTLVFDALDRLIAIQDEDRQICYTYDFLGRRLSKQVGFALTSYFYDDQDEIGSVTNGHIDEIRILGQKNHAEIGATVFMQLQGQIYVPIHDFQGNIACLNAPDGSFELYSYTAFGQELFASAKSPWRFSSKRTDLETGFSYFGKRYYIPSLGRWLTQDPLGILESPNLYAFVSGCPLTHFDLYGLLDEASWHRQPRVQAALQMWVGATEMGLGAGATAVSGGTAFCLGAILFTHGFDNFVTGFYSLLSGSLQQTAIVSSLQQAGLSPSLANGINDILGLPSFIYGNPGKIVSAVATETRALSTITQTVKQSNLAKITPSITKTRIPTRHNYSELYRKAHPSPGKNFDVHHVFPQKFEKDFSKYGINIHESKYLTYWERTSHKQTAWGYNKEWRGFIDKHPDATIPQILEQGKGLMKEYGINVNY